MKPYGPESLSLTSIGKTTATVKVVSWDTTSAVVPDEIYFHDKDDASNVVYQELGYYPKDTFNITGLTQDTSYRLVAVTRVGGNFSPASEELYITTNLADLRPVTNLSLNRPYPKTIDITWTKPDVDVASTFDKISISIIGQGINEVIYINDVNVESTGSIPYLDECTTLETTATVHYVEGDSISINDTLSLGPSNSNLGTPLLSNFSMLELRETMRYAGDYFPLNNFREVNSFGLFPTGVWGYDKLSRGIMVDTSITAITKFTQLIGYPIGGIGIVRPNTTTVTNAAQLTTLDLIVSTSKRWKIYKIGAIWEVQGLTTATEHSNTTYVNATLTELRITENPDTTTRTGYIEVRYETVGCSNVYDGMIPVKNAIVTNRVEIIQAGKVVVDPDPGNPPDDSIDSLLDLASKIVSRPMILPFEEPVKTKLDGATCAAAYSDLVPLSYLNYVHGLDVTFQYMDEKLEDNEEIMEAMLVADTTDGYYINTSNSANWKNLAGVTEPAIGIAATETYSVYGFSVGKLNYYQEPLMTAYNETIVRELYNANRLHIALDAVPVGQISEVLIPVHIGNSTEAMLAETIIHNTARVFVTPITYLKATLSPEHHGMGGLSLKQRKVISLSAEGADYYYSAYTEDLRPDAKIDGHWVLVMGTGSKPIYFPILFWS